MKRPYTIFVLTRITGVTRLAISKSVMKTPGVNAMMEANNVPVAPLCGRLAQHHCITQRGLVQQLL